MKPVQAAGFVLAGGRSSRMGRDKALIPLAGRPMVKHAVELLTSAGLSATIAGARPDLAQFAPVIPDSDKDRGPLHGICRCLEQAQPELAVFLSVDMPLVPAGLILSLLEHAQDTGNAVTLASLGGVPHTFPVVLRRDCLPVLSHELEQGSAGCMRAFRAAAAAAGQADWALAVEDLPPHPSRIPPATWFLNVNTPEELAEAERWFPGPIA